MVHGPQTAISTGWPARFQQLLELPSVSQEWKCILYTDQEKMPVTHLGHSNRIADFCHSALEGKKE